jgi:type II secretion system protein N
MRTALLAAAAAALFAIVLGLSFPTDQLVRWGLARAPVPEARLITFQRAHLRPWGLLLEGARLRDPGGGPFYEADWLRFRPSWTGLAGDGLGRPWRVAAGALGGTIEASLGLDGGAQTVELTWADLDVGRLLAALHRPDQLSGRASGSTGLRVPVADAASGSGEVVLQDAVWQPALGALEDLPLHAERATLRWRLADGRFEVAAFDAHGREMNVAASGQVRLAGVADASTLDLRVTLTPLPGMPGKLRPLLDGLPRGADGTRDFVLTGTLDAPRIAPP